MFFHGGAPDLAELLVRDHIDLYLDRLCSVALLPPVLAAKQTVPLDTIAQNLWLRIIQDGLLGGKTRLRILRN